MALQVELRQLESLGDFDGVGSVFPDVENLVLGVGVSTSRNTKESAIETLETFTGVQKWGSDQRGQSSSPLWVSLAQSG